MVSPRAYRCGAYYIGRTLFRRTTSSPAIWCRINKMLFLSVCFISLYLSPSLSLSLSQSLSLSLSLFTLSLSYWCSLYSLCIQYHRYATLPSHFFYTSSPLLNSSLFFFSLLVFLTFVHKKIYYFRRHFPHLNLSKWIDRCPQHGSRDPPLVQYVLYVRTSLPRTWRVRKSEKLIQ